MTKLSYREFVEHVIPQVEGMVASIEEPEASLPPFAICQGRDGSLDLLDLSDADYVVGDAVAGFIQFRRTSEVAVVGTVWMVEYENEAIPPESERPLPAEHPDRFEALIVLIVDAEYAEAWRTRVERSASSPPALGEWSHDTDRTATISGETVDLIREALR